MPAHDHFHRLVADVLGGERLVGRAVFQQAAAVDARFVAEGCRTDNGFFRREGTARGVRHKVAQHGKLPRIHAAVFPEREPHGHDDLVQCRVASTFAEAVDGDARGVRAGSERGNGVGRGHAEIVVTVKFQT